MAILLSWSPWRIPGSYQIPILGNSTAAFRYVRAHLRDGDQVMATEPHAHAGFLEADQIDFDLAVPRLYDFLVIKDGALIDRNGGTVSVSGVSELQRALTQHDRIWILLNREKFRTRGKNLRWEYPGARVEHFIRRNGSLEYETYLWSVFLWDASRGHFVHYRSDSN